jgi:hypothetical protein
MLLSLSLTEHICCSSLSVRARIPRLNARQDAGLGALDTGGHGEPNGGEASCKWSPETRRRRGAAAADRAARRPGAAGGKGGARRASGERHAHQERDGGLRRGRGRRMATPWSSEATAVCGEDGVADSDWGRPRPITLARMLGLARRRCWRGRLGLGTPATAARSGARRARVCCACSQGAGKRGRVRERER